jgi:hypothetical protein
LNLRGSVYPVWFLSTGSWYHIAVTHESSGTTKVFLNGALDMSMQDTGFKAKGNMWFANYETTHGGDASGNSNQHYSKGAIDELQGWPTALTALDINEIYSKENGGSKFC